MTAARAARRVGVAAAIVLLATTAGTAACHGHPVGTPTPAPSPPAAPGGIDAPDDVSGAPSAALPRATAIPDTSPATACDPSKPHAAGDETATLRSGDLDRSYIIHVPKNYDGARGMPLVLNFHGFGSGARQQALYSRLPAKGDLEGFITVSPEGSDALRRWNYPGVGGVDDVAFVRDLLDRLETDLCVDARRVFAAGISNGSAFAQIVACAMPDRIAAVAAVAALVFPARLCDGVPPVPVIAFHGTDDPCVPFAGGTTQCGLRLPVAAVEDSARNWAQRDACGLAPADAQVSTHVRAISYSECAAHAAVVLLVVDGGGHTWLGSVDVPRLGATTHEIDATDEIWQFFAAHARRP